MKVCTYRFSFWHISVFDQRFHSIIFSESVGPSSFKQHPSQYLSIIMKLRRFHCYSSYLTGQYDTILSLTPQWNPLLLTLTVSIGHLIQAWTRTIRSSDWPPLCQISRMCTSKSPRVHGRSTFFSTTLSHNRSDGRSTLFRVYHPNHNEPCIGD